MEGLSKQQLKQVICLILLFYICEQIERQKMIKERRQTIKISQRCLEIGRHENISEISNSPVLLDIYLALMSSWIIIFTYQMQSKLKAKNIKSQDNASLQEQGSVSENESQFYLPSRTVRRIFGADGNLFMKKKKPMTNKCHWTLKENLLYKQFLKKKTHLFDSNFFQRKNSKINVMMSDQIKIKTPKQCRSHHQKMMKKHQTVAGIIKFIESLEEDHSQLEIQLESQRQRPQSCIQNSCAQQINEKIEAEQKLQMVQACPPIELPSQIESLPQQDIFSGQIEVNVLNYDLQFIEDYLQPNVWWDGFDI